MFGKYAIVDNAEYHLELEPDLFWKFVPATPEAELAIARFYQEKTRIVKDGQGNPIPVGPNWIEVMCKELSFTFGGTNIPAFPESPSQDEVEKILLKAPQKLVEELWKALGERVAGWGPRPQPEAEAGTTNSKSSKTPSETPSSPEPEIGS